MHKQESKNVVQIIKYRFLKQKYKSIKYNKLAINFPRLNVPFISDFN